MPVLSTEFTLGALAVYVVGKDLVGFLMRKKNPMNGLVTKLDDHIGTADTAHEQIRDLHRWHDVKDIDGTPIWYVRRSLEEAIREQTKAMRTLVESISALRTTIDKMNGGVGR